MSVVGGTDAITDGLVVYLDSTNTKSFKGEATVNLIPNPDFSNSTTGWSANSNVTLSVVAHGALRLLKVKSNQTTSTPGFLSGNIPVSASTTYTLTIRTFKNDAEPSWLYATGDGTGGADIIWTGGTNGPNPITTSITTITRTFTTPSNMTYIRVGALWSAPELTSEIYVQYMQLEQKSYATPFVNGTRGSSVETGGGWANLVSTINNAVVYGVSGVGNVLSLDGVDDYIEIPNATSLVQGQSQFTMGLWCKLDVVNLNLRGLIGTGNYSCTANLIMTANNATLTFYNDTTSCASVSWSTPLVANKWIFAVARFDGTNSVVGGSIDGGALSYNSAVLKTGITNVFTSGFRIMAPYHEYRTSGDVGIAFVYNRYLSDVELANIFKFTKYRFGF